ncbi:hypothetical protein HK099_000458 [Clydaea vesicula]|uniref:Fe2OG dioxygenase domain-containing protein n=1 Tax=Clydaea vesicula TaxID=447962 RepID=A0AAD5U5N6_9FUNG|nr:hypothetical protein HK099_000458 [Clydaea vesicula]
MTTAENLDHLCNPKLPESIPLIDFSDYNSTDLQKKVNLGKKLVDAFSTAGFVYLKNCPLDNFDRDEMFKTSKEFFAKSSDYKVNLEWESAESNRGYVQQGREKLTELDKVGRADEIGLLRQVSPDIKETFEIGKENPNGKFQNRWPDDEFGKKFKSTSLKFYDQMHKINVEIMKLLNFGLDLPEGYLDSFVTDGDNNLRLLHYPSVEKKTLSKENKRAGAHCDYGSITLLLQDMSGGLEVKDYKTGEYVKATPIADTIVVNVGDMMQRWTNDKFKSTLHRVVKPYISEDETTYPARFSIAYFCNPNFDSIIECLPTCVDEGNPKKYGPISSFEHLVERLSSTYA